MSLFASRRRWPSRSRAQPARPGTRGSWTRGSISPTAINSIRPRDAPTIRIDHSSGRSASDEWPVPHSLAPKLPRCCWRDCCPAPLSWPTLGCSALLRSKRYSPIDLDPCGHYRADRVTPCQTGLNGHSGCCVCRHTSSIDNAHVSYFNAIWMVRSFEKVHVI